MQIKATAYPKLKFVVVIYTYIYIGWYSNTNQIKIQTYKPLLFAIKPN